VTSGQAKYYDMQVFTKANTFIYIPPCVYMYRSRNDIKNPSLTQRDIISTVQNDINIGNKIKPLLSENEYKYFQINVFRSVLWKICDPDFNQLKPEHKNNLLILFRAVVSGYDKEVVKKYFSLEEPLLSLIDKGFIQEALDFNAMLISRRWWYQKGIELKTRYKKQGKIRGSIYWRLTKPLRAKIIFQLKRKFFRRNVKNANYNSAPTRG
ncbi:glycosyltransferase family 2 protein, partial [Neobacillus drentensis]